MSTYQMQSDYRCLSPKFEPCRAGYENRIESKEKDMLISQLKAHIFELEQHEKDYDSLNQHYKQLQNDYSLLNEAKIRLEYELKQKDDNFNKTMCDLRGENENLQLGLNEKLSVNKKLYSENDIIGKQIGLKNSEISDLNVRLNDVSRLLNRSHEDRQGLQNMIQNLNGVKLEQNNQIVNLIDDNKKLTQICQQQDQSIKCGDCEKMKLLRSLDENNFNIKNLNERAKIYENDINNVQNQLKNCNNLNNKLQNIINDYEKELDLCKNENCNLKNQLLNEKNTRADLCKKNNQLINILNDRERELNQLNCDFNNMQTIVRNSTNDQNSFKNENDKLKNHVFALTEQNQKLIDEMDRVIIEDSKVKKLMDRKQRIGNILQNNKTKINNSLNSLDASLSRVGCNIPECE